MLFVFLNRKGVLRGLSLPLSGVFALFFLLLSVFLCVRSSPCLSLMLRCFLPCSSFLFLIVRCLFSHFVLLFGRLLLASVAVCLHLSLVLFAFELPLPGS